MGRLMKNADAQCVGLRDCLGRLPPSRLRRYGGQAANGLSSEARTASEGGRPQADKFAGGHRIRVPPVPIPNTEVKPDTADGTVWETVWESRSLPALIDKKARREHWRRASGYRPEVAGDRIVTDNHVSEEPANSSRSMTIGTVSQRVLPIILMPMPGMLFVTRNRVPPLIVG